MKKNYVVDTNVLVHYPKSLHSFEENDVYVPIEVVVELDHLKSPRGDLDKDRKNARNAREATRTIEELRQKGCLTKGVPLPGGGTFRILLNNGGGVKVIRRAEHGNRADRRNECRIETNGNWADGQILKSAIRLRDSSTNPTVLVTKDINLRIIAESLNLAAEDYEADKVPVEGLYTGAFDLEVSETEIKSAQRDGSFALTSPHGVNEYVTLFAKPGKGPKAQQVYMRVDPTGKTAKTILSSYDGIWGIKPRNREQHFAFDALLDDRIKLVTMMGKAGTGKTLMAMAAGLKRTVADRSFRRVVVARPTISVGKEIGFLPGTLEEKLNPWMQPIHDALDLLADLNTDRNTKMTSAELMRSGAIVVEALSYIRGRSIANQFMIIDEAQNLTPLEVKTIVTRVSKGTKLVFTGDPYQIDNPYLDTSSNGFNYLVSKLRGEVFCAHIGLQKGERSELAEWASENL